MWYLWAFRWDDAKFVWGWVAWNIVWTFYQVRATRVAIASRARLYLLLSTPPPETPSR